MSVLYHHDKANVVADAQINFSIGCVFYVEETKRKLVKDIHMLARLGVQIEDSPNGGIVVHYNFEFSLVIEVKSKQHLAPLLIELKDLVLGKINESFSRGDGVLGSKEDCV